MAAFICIDIEGVRPEFFCCTTALNICTVFEEEYGQFAAVRAVFICTISEEEYGQFAAVQLHLL